MRASEEPAAASERVAKYINKFETFEQLSIFKNRPRRVLRTEASEYEIDTSPPLQKSIGIENCRISCKDIGKSLPKLDIQSESLFPSLKTMPPSTAKLPITEEGEPNLRTSKTKFFTKEHTAPMFDLCPLSREPAIGKFRAEEQWKDRTQSILQMNKSKYGRSSNAMKTPRGSQNAALYPVQQRVEDAYGISSVQKGNKKEEKMRTLKNLKQFNLFRSRLLTPEHWASTPHPAQKGDLHAKQSLV